MGEGSVVEDAISSGTQMPENTYGHPGKRADEPSADWTRDAGTSSGGDCVRTAASILEQLDSAQRGAYLLGSSSIITDACQRLLTILVCPCSDQPAVALLVASGCMALMDAFCRHGHKTASTATTAASPASLWTDTVHRHMDEHDPARIGSDLFCWPTLSPPPRPLSVSLNSLVDPQQSGIEGLARIAKVVLRFTERYANEPHGAEGGPSGAYTTLLVEPIVLLLRSKLQSVTHEAVGRLML